MDGGSEVTPEEFWEKFPKRIVNDDRLLDIACGKCGNRNLFRAWPVVSVDIDDASVTLSARVEFIDSDEVMCGQCAEEGEMQDFEIKGLDEFMNKRIPSE